MEITNRKNRDLIIKFIELNELISARNKLESEMTLLNNDISKITMDISSKYEEVLRQRHYLKSSEEYLKRDIESIKATIEILKTNIDKGYDILENGMNNYNMYSKASYLINDIEKVRSDMFIEINNIKSKFPELQLDYNKLHKLSLIIFEQENLDLDINKLFNKDIYRCINILEEDINNHHAKCNIQKCSSEIYKCEEYINKQLEKVEVLTKKKVDGNNTDSKIEAMNMICSEFCNENKKMIDDITNDIENNFVKLIPMKYIFDDNFRNYAVESLFYERENSIGELLNAYDTLEFNHEMRDKFKDAISGIDNIQINQFHQLMGLEEISYGIDKSNKGLKTISKGIKGVEKAIDRGFEGISDLIIEASVKDELAKEELIYSNYKIIDGQKELLTSNNNINRSIESNNMLAKRQLDSLSYIDSETREIAKKIYDVKEFTDRYRDAKYIEGKTYY